MLLSFVAHEGGKYFALADRFGVQASTYHDIVLRLIDIICSELLPKFVCWPSAEHQLLMAKHIEDLYGFPGVVGCVDGTHIPIRRPKDDDSPNCYYINRLKNFSLVLQLTAVEDMSFSHVESGCPGSVHDARLFKRSDLWFETGARIDALFCRPDLHLLGDSAYMVKSYLMPPFKRYGELTRAHNVYNKHHAAARSLVERAIGKLKGRWKRLSFVNVFNPDKADKIALTCVTLHNMCHFKGDVLPDEEEVCDPRNKNAGLQVGFVIGRDTDGIQKRYNIMHRLAALH